MIAQQEYKIKKRKPIQTEELEPPTKNERPRFCIYCDQPANYWAYFKVDKVGTLLKEKHCQRCLDKYVYLDGSVNSPSVKQSISDCNKSSDLILKRSPSFVIP